MKKVLMVINVDWLFFMHRMCIGEQAIHQDYQVMVATKDTGYSKKIDSAGLIYMPLLISRSSINIFKEGKLFYKMFQLYKRNRPDIVYHVTMKPVIYGSIIARILNIKTLNAISGLGYNFTAGRKGNVQKIMIKLMKFGFASDNVELLFENSDDYQELNDLGIISVKNKINFTKGVGTNLELYRPLEKAVNDKIIILLPTRMLWDKGVKEFVKVAHILQNRYYGKVLFQLCGMVDLDNNEGVPESYLHEIEVQGYIEWIGFQENMVEIYQKSDIVVLPSYREGMPTVLIEACATGKPIVTTDAIGCRECVEEGLNGYKVPIKSIIELADAIEKLIESPEDRKRMGLYSRNKAEDEFDQKDFVKLHMDIFESMLSL